MTPPAMRPPAAELARLDADFAARNVRVDGDAVVSVRECGAADAPAIVCLHGIGSGAASWLDVATRLAPHARLIAWDAPGYGASTALAQAAPRAIDHAGRLGQLLDALQIEHCTLVGHSLGALPAAAACGAGAATAGRIDKLILLAPARGYGTRPERAHAVRTERLDALAMLGIAGVAAGRSSRLLSEGATETMREWVRWNMARLHDAGYRQAIELLCNDDLLAALPPACPVQVLCGDRDVVTPPEACGEVARACNVRLEAIAGAGHACYVERPDAVAAVLREAIAC